MNLHHNNKGMTMIEILTVLVVISTLFALFFYVWNTIDIFRKSRDSKRINDLYALDTALKTILATEDNINLGQENIIYTSLPDSSSTCGSYNLIPVSSPYFYHCQPTANYLKVDGSGWIPINFGLGKILTIDLLPIDPLNNKDYFYAYQVKQGRYKLTARFESKSNILKMINDGGFEPTLYEVGSNLFIPSPHSGLVGYWSFDEATGTIAYDKSGYGNNGTMYSSTTPTDLHSTSSCKIGYCSSFDGVDDYIGIGGINSNFASIEFWAYFPQTITATFTCQQVIKYGSATDPNNNQEAIVLGACTGYIDNETLTILGDNGKRTAIKDVLSSGWNHIVITWNGSSSRYKFYVNGLDKVVYSSISGHTPLTPIDDFKIGYAINPGGGADYFNGLIDEVRVYNRALSDSEIKALYEATK